MTKKTNQKKEMGCCSSDCGCKSWSHRSKCGGVYGLGFLGAVIYYISTATSFLVGVIGVLKAIVWPAFLVYYLLKFLGA